MVDLSSFIETITIATTAKAAWPFVKPILENAKDAFEDMVKDAASDKLKDVLKGDEWKKAVAHALKAFLVHFHETLNEAGVDESARKAYQQSLIKYVKDKAVLKELGGAITDDRSVSAMVLAKRWDALNLTPLPSEFNWFTLIGKYHEECVKILEADEVLRSIVSTRAEKQTAQATERIAGGTVGFDLNKYAETLCKRYGVLKIDSLYPDAHSRMMELTKVFVEQTVRSSQKFNPRLYELPADIRKELKEKGALLKDFDKEWIAQEREQYFQQQPRPVLEVIYDARQEQRLLVILGDPGSGKSVLLNHCALQWAEAPLAERAKQKVPLLIELKTFARDRVEQQCTDFLQHCDHGANALFHLNQHHIKELLQRGEAIVLLDGLDEIFNVALRKEVVTQIIRYSTEYKDVQFIVTSRIIGYDLVAQDLRNADFHHFMLQELDPDQQLTFLTKWHELAYLFSFAIILILISSSNRL